MNKILIRSNEGNVYYYPKLVRDKYGLIVCETFNRSRGLCYRRKKVYLYKVSLDMPAVTKYEWLCLRCVSHLKQKGWNIEQINEGELS